MLFQLKKALNLLTPPLVMAYRGYGTRRRVYLRGHVLEDRLLYEAQRSHGRRKNLRAMLSRYLSTVIPDVRVRIRFAGQEQLAVTDDQGYFAATFTFDRPLAETGWLPAHYRVIDEVAGQQGPEQHGEVYIRNPDCRFGVISDVDDTILISHATKWLKKLRLILTKNAKTRLPFHGVAAFYQALQAGTGSTPPNPVFYVSSSEWNLHDFLIDFCEARDIPKGPFLLQDIKIDLWELLRSGGGTHEHKADKVRHLLEVFKDLPFVLIGDSGQHDADLYARIAEDLPNRVRAIYIRDVAGERQSRRIIQLAKQLAERGVAMRLVKDTAQAARHAWEIGLITEEEYRQVQTAVSAQQ